MLLLMGLFFVMLKLAGVVHWPWFVVLIPLYTLIVGIITLLVRFFWAEIHLGLLTWRNSRRSQRLNL